MNKKLQFTLLLTLVVLLNAFTGKAQTNFGELKAAIKEPEGKVYFFTDKAYFRYNTDNSKLEKKAKILGVWKGLPDHFDAALVNPGNQRAYFFKGDKYYKYNFKTGKEFIGKIGKDGWRGVPANIDAAVVHPNDKIYFFKGDKYYRYSHALGKVDKVANISNWKGVPKNLDAALLDKTGTIYFFKGNKYYRYNTKTGVDKVGIIGKDGWRGLSFAKELQNAVPSSKNNLRLKVTLTRIKSVQARDSDNIADFLLDQIIYYKTKGISKEKIKRSMRKFSLYKDAEEGFVEHINKGQFNPNFFEDFLSKNYSEDDIKANFLIYSYNNNFHIKEGDEKFYINNSLTFEITPDEIKDKRADFKIYTDLGENDGLKSSWIVQNFAKIFETYERNIKWIASNEFINVPIYDILDYLQHPNASKYSGKKYFNGGYNKKTHESGAFGDVMWFERASNNALKGTLEFGNNESESYVRFYYRFELVP